MTSVSGEKKKKTPVNLSKGAQDEPQLVDLSTMTDDELVELSRDIGDEMLARRKRNVKALLKERAP